MSLLFAYNQGKLHLSHSITDVPDPISFKTHTHTTVEIYCFLQGEGVFRVEGNEYPLESGDLLIMAPAESHYITPSPNQAYERKVLYFPLDLIRMIDPNGYLLTPILERSPGKDNLYKACEFKNGSCLHYFEDMMCELGDRKINILAGLIPLLNEIRQIYIRHLGNTTEENSESIENQIVHYINQNLAQNLSLDSICGHFYISKSQLCRTFKASTGSSVWQYITTKRLIRAKQLIDAGENPTHIYATQCGFRDYSSFYRAYVKHFGYAPSKDK